MGKIYEDIEIEGKMVRVKVDTASDFPLALTKETIERLNLPLSPRKAITFREEEGKRREYREDVWLARIKIGNCEFAVPQVVVVASGENLLGHPILQTLGAKIDEKKERMVFDMEKCPRGETGELMGRIID